MVLNSKLCFRCLEDVVIYMVLNLNALLLVLRGRDDLLNYKLCFRCLEDVVTYTQTGVTVHWRSVEGEEPRAKRMVHPAGMRGFPHQEKMAIVKKHNSLRKAQYSSNMNYMVSRDLTHAPHNKNHAHNIL